MSNKNTLIILTISLIIFGCASPSGTSTSYCPSCLNSVWRSYGNAGGIILNDKISGDPSLLQGTANAYCKEKGMSGGIVDVTSRGKDYDALFDKVSYRFNCVAAQPEVINNSAVQGGSGNASVALEDAKKKCIELGFKANTPELGKCVLQLSK